MLLTEKYLYNQVSNCIFGYNKLLLAYSGGLDSTVLLDILVTLTKNSDVLIKPSIPAVVRAVFVHHGISEQSNRWANHCQDQCKIRDISCDVIYINYFNFHKKNCNIESVARSLRYKSLCNFLNTDEILLTAHHMDDQTETVLLALKRGSGPAGLSGIHKSIILYDQYLLLRPLLQCSRAQLTEYAIQKKLVWIEDDTNTNVRFDRNFFRIKIVPVLKNRWPSFDKVVSRTAKLCRNQEYLLRELLLELLNELIDVDGALFFYPLLQFSILKREAILRMWIRNFTMDMPTYKVLNRIWKEVALSKIDANPVLFLGKNICRRFQKKLYILPISMATSVSIGSLSWNVLDKVILLPDKLGLLVSQILIVNSSFYKEQMDLHFDSKSLLDIFFDYYKSPGKILTHCLVRFPQSQEKILIRFGPIYNLLYILNRNRGRKLKKIWQELNIPPWLRNRIPLLFYNNTLIAALGVFITHDGYALNTINVVDNNNYIVWRVFWLQDIFYYKFFKNVIKNTIA